MKMKKNIIVINGSSHVNSITRILINDLLNRIRLKMGEQNIKVYNVHDLLFCKGCANCFLNGICPLDNEDRMKKIKTDLMKSDIIILASPTYLKSVSGQMKVFIDRTSYMTHLFKLAGKTGILISTGSCNGVDETIEYLNFYAERIGLINIQKISLKKILDSQNKMEKKLDEIVEKLYIIFHNKELHISQSSENIFQSYKQNYKNMFTHFEQKYLYENGIDYCDNYKEFILRRNKCYYKRE